MFYKSFNKISIIGLSASEFSNMIAAAVRLGASDAMARHPERKGVDIASMWATEWRKGHARALRQAYMAGRFHAETANLED